MTLSIAPPALKTRNPNLPIAPTFRDQALADALAFYDFATMQSATVLTDLSGRGNHGIFNVAPVLTADGWSMNGTTYFDMPDDLGDTAVAHFMALKVTALSDVNIGGNIDTSTGSKGTRFFHGVVGGAVTLQAQVGPSNTVSQPLTESVNPGMTTAQTAIWMAAVYNGRTIIERMDTGTAQASLRRLTAIEAGLPLANGIRWGRVRGIAGNGSSVARMGALLTINLPRGMPSRATKIACAALVRATMAARGVTAL